MHCILLTSRHVMQRVVFLKGILPKYELIWFLKRTYKATSLSQIDMRLKETFSCL